MAPSIAEEQPHRADIVVPVKASPAAAEKPKIRRIIDEEGGTTTASVRSFCLSDFPGSSDLSCIPTTSRSGITARNIHPWSPSHTATPACAQTRPSQTY